MAPARAPGRIVNVDRVVVGADGHDVVIAAGPIFEQQNQRFAGGDSFAQKRD
jgi:hypothetical protein